MEFVEERNGARKELSEKNKGERIDGIKNSIIKPMRGMNIWTRR